METRDALLEVIGNRAAQDTLEAAGWRRRDGEWLPPAEEPKPLTWDALCLKGSVYFPWGREIVDDNAPALTWSISDPLSGSWKCQGVHANSYGDLYYHFQYVPTTVPSESVYRGEGPTGRVLDNGKIRFTDPKFPSIIWSDPHPLRCDAGPETHPLKYKVLWSGEVREKFDREIDRLERCKATCDDYWRAEDKRNYRLQLLLLHGLKEALGL